MKTVEKPVYEQIDTVTIDEQNDFNWGTLSVPGAERTVPYGNRLGQFALENGGQHYLSQDWHPKKTVHFKRFPVHCIAGTPGAEFTAGLVTESAIILRKGQRDDEDGFSAWEAYDEGGTSLEYHLFARRNQRRAVILTGVATEYCVGETGERGLVTAAKWKEQGDGILDFYIPTDAIRGINEEASQAMLQRLQKMGAKLCTVAEILNGDLFTVKAA